MKPEIVPCQTAAKVPEIQRALNELCEITETVLSLASEVRGRVEPVLEPDADPAVRSEGGKQAHPVPLVNDLCEIRLRAESAACVLRDILDRLEL